jgi:tetratricopeptide (TPR) repeat protein
MKKHVWIQAALISALCAGGALAQTTNQATPAPTTISAGSLLPVPTPGLSAAEYSAQSKAYIAQARAAYPTPFIDLPLWAQAVAYAEAAVQLEPNNAIFVRDLAMAYATTQWWFRAMFYFDRLETLNAFDSQSRSMAALTARKLGVLALGRGAGLEASSYLRRSLILEANATTRALLDRVNITYGF